MNLADKSRKDTKQQSKDLQNNQLNMSYCNGSPVECTGPNDGSESTEISEDICAYEGKIHVQLLL